VSRKSFAHVLSDYRWLLLGVLGVVAFALGCYGFTQYLDGLSVGDLLYRTFKLFLLSAPEGPGLPLSLEVARILAPIVAGWATLAALANVFRDRAQQMRIPLMRKHVVVCGLGYVGSVFVRQLREAGARVVVIELDPANPLIDLCRSLRIPVVVGDAQLERTLRSAGARRASRLLAVCPHDAVNAEIVAVARRLVATRPRGQLRCLARISDPDLCALLRVQETNLPDNSASSLDYFNTDELSARLWLDEFPVDSRPHILVSRLGALGRWLVLHAAFAWHESPTNPAPLWVTVVDDDAEERVVALLGEYPDVEKVCRFRCTSTSAGDIARLVAADADGEAPPISAAYVSADRDEEALEAALVLRHELDSAVPMVIALSRAHGVSRLIDDASGGGELTNIDVFPTLERTCTIELVAGGSYHRIAEAIHRRWRAEQLAAGKPAPTWRELDDELRESNRAQARDIIAKLHSVGCEIAPLRHWGAAQIAFTVEEVEKLAVAEHDRWVTERRQAGWVPGPDDSERRTSPYLVAFTDLPDDVADLDRSAVRGIPTALASAGLQVVRRAEKRRTELPT
jgi:voltage-gated potassium channel Kch